MNLQIDISVLEDTNNDSNTLYNKYLVLKAMFTIVADEGLKLISKAFLDVYHLLKEERRKGQVNNQTIARLQKELEVSNEAVRTCKDKYKKLYDQFMKIQDEIVPESP